MANPTCDVCGTECEPKTLVSFNGKCGRNNRELFTPEMLRELQREHTTLVVCQEPGKSWYSVHPADTREIPHRNRRVGSKLLEQRLRGADSGYTEVASHE